MLKTGAEGKAEGKVDLGDLTATILSALSSVSADARFSGGMGAGGVTVGLVVTPSQRDIENQRVITPIPLPQEHGIGKINLEALFGRLLDEFVARTLPTTRRAEHFATLLRFGLVTDAESQTIESLLHKGAKARGDSAYAKKIVDEAKAALAALDSETSTVARAILTTVLVAAERQYANTSSERQIFDIDWSVVGDGAVGGAGLGAAIGAASGAAAGGVGEIPGAIYGAIYGGLIGGLVSGGIKFHVDD